jgi:hypothetical protein
MLTGGHERLKREGIDLWLAAFNPSVFAMFERSRLGQALGRQRMFLNVEQAVERYRQRQAQETR